MITTFIVEHRWQHHPERQKEKRDLEWVGFTYESSWLHDWGGSGFSDKKLKEIEEGGSTYWGGGCMLHKLGNPVIIC